MIAAVKAAGFVGSTTVVPGWASPSEDPYRLPRLRVLGGTSPAALLGQIASAEAAARRRVLRGCWHGVSATPRVRPGERPAILRASKPNVLIGIAVSVLSVAAATAAIYPLKNLAPVVSLSVVYLPAVLLVSAYWGLPLGLATSLLSAAAFNLFHLPPTGRFTIADSRNWVALGAFVLAAAAISTVAELARAARSRPTAGGPKRTWRPRSPGICWAARRPRARWPPPPGGSPQALGIASVSIELGAVEGDRRRQALALSGADGRQIATLLVPRRPIRGNRRSGCTRRGASARGARRDRAATGRAAGRGRRDGGAAAQ